MTEQFVRYNSIVSKRSNGLSFVLATRPYACCVRVYISHLSIHCWIRDHATQHRQQWVVRGYLTTRQRVLVKVRESTDTTSISLHCPLLPETPTATAPVFCARWSPIRAVSRLKICSRRDRRAVRPQAIRGSRADTSITQIALHCGLR